MINYFRRVKQLWTQKTEEKVGPGLLLILRRMHRETHTLKKTGGPTWNYLVL